MNEHSQIRHWTKARIFSLIIAVIAWISIILQYAVAEISLVNFFSFFTILTNLLIAVSLSFSALAPATLAGQFFSKLSVQSAIALYIFIVGLVYNLVLRGIVPLAGWGLVADTMVHVIDPVLYILFWFAFRSKGNLQWKEGLFWLVFPLIYLVYSLVRGSIIDWYPYPFLNLNEHGYEKVLLNIGIMLLVFLIGGLILIFLTRRTYSKAEAD